MLKDTGFAKVSNKKMVLAIVIFIAMVVAIPSYIMFNIYTSTYSDEVAPSTVVFYRDLLLFEKPSFTPRVC